jgi:cytoskeletal protein CcmA (bactofilin family)
LSSWFDNTHGTVRDPMQEETMAVSKLNSYAEQVSEFPGNVRTDAGLSEGYARRPAPVSRGRQEGLLLIGEGAKIKGEILKCRVIEIQGTVEGDLEAEVLIVHGNGVLKGNVNTDRAEVHGSIVGDVIVKHLLDVKAKGSVRGKTEYGELLVEAGGRLVGTCDEEPDKKDKPAGALSHRPAADPIRTARKTATKSKYDNWYV